MTTPRKRPRQARELVLDRPFWMHHLTGGLQVLLGSNRQCLLLAPEVGMRAFTLRAGARAVEFRVQELQRKLQ